MIMMNKDNLLVNLQKNKRHKNNQQAGKGTAFSDVAYFTPQR